MNIELNEFSQSSNEILTLSEILYNFIEIKSLKGKEHTYVSYLSGKNVKKI